MRSWVKKNINPTIVSGMPYAGLWALCDYYSSLAGGEVGPLLPTTVPTYLEEAYERTINPTASNQARPDSWTLTARIKWTKIGRQMVQGVFSGIPGQWLNDGANLGMAMPPAIPPETINSQKVAGLKLLGQISMPYGLTAMGKLTINTVVGKNWLAANLSPEDGKNWWASVFGDMKEVFARPCPVRPRHGFVDSRVVRNVEELKVVVIETLAVEPDGVVMLTPYYRSELSFVHTPSLLAVGPGNDGATAGHGAISIPIPPITDPKQKGAWEWKPEILKAAGIGPDEEPYLEIVKPVENPSTYNPEYVITQLRAGPKVESGLQADYIPATTMVESILDTTPFRGNPEKGTTDDLVGWEAAVQAIRTKPGAVVYHPGGSPVDHWYVHARSYGIPVITTRPIVIGDVLEKVTGLVPLDPMAVLKGVIAADKVELTRSKLTDAVYGILIGLHYSSLLEGEGGKMVGMAAGIMLRAGSLALLGEGRHLGRPMNKPNRDTIYIKYLNRSVSFHQRWLPRNHYVFRYGKWTGGGFGGKKWAQCALALDPLFRAVGELARNPTQESVGSLIRALNVAVNQAHNGGFWLNKFIDTTAMNAIPAGYYHHYLIHGGAGLLYCNEVYRRLTPDDIERARKTYGSKWRTAPLGPPMERLSVNLLPGTGKLVVSARFRYLKDYNKLAMVDLSPITEGNPGDGRISLVKEDGIAKVMWTGGGQSLQLWAEEFDPTGVFTENEVDDGDDDGDDEDDGDFDPNPGPPGTVETLSAFALSQGYGGCGCPECLNEWYHLEDHEVEYIDFLSTYVPPPPPADNGADIPF